MFGFLLDAENYEDRMIDRGEFDWGFISTAKVSEGERPYETAVQSSDYGNADDLEDTNGMIIVEAYDSAEDAQKGHNRWVKTMTKNPPEELVDCLNSGWASLLETIDNKPREIRK